MARKMGVRCSVPTCSGVVRDDVCDVCGPKKRSDGYDVNRSSAASRGYDRRWQKLRMQILRAEPLCRACAQRGLVVAATDVDHVIPKRNGGKDVKSNLQALCHSCHSAKTASGS